MREAEVDRRRGAVGSGFGAGGEWLVDQPDLRSVEDHLDPHRPRRRCRLGAVGAGGSCRCGSNEEVSPQDRLPLVFDRKWPFVVVEGGGVVAASSRAICDDDVDRRVRIEKAMDSSEPSGLEPITGPQPHHPLGVQRRIERAPSSADADLVRCDRLAANRGDRLLSRAVVGRVDVTVRRVDDHDSDGAFHELSA